MFFQYNEDNLRIKSFLFSNQFLNLPYFLLGILFGEMNYCIQKKHLRQGKGATNAEKPSRPGKEAANAEKHLRPGKEAANAESHNYEIHNDS